MNSLNHVAIIMDGNGRWGVKYKKSRNAGHKAGLKTVERIIKASVQNKIKHLTLFAFILPAKSQVTYLNHFYKIKSKTYTTKR